jgi:hypothetical protein
MYTGKSRSICLLVVTIVLALALWFSRTAVIPSLRVEFGLNDLQASLFTSFVQIGFIVGALLSAVFGLADRIEPRRFISLSAFVGGCFNYGLLYVDPVSEHALALRFLTGV